MTLQLFLNFDGVVGAGFAVYLGFEHLNHGSNRVGVLKFYVPLCL